MLCRGQCRDHALFIQTLKRARARQRTLQTSDGYSSTAVGQGASSIHCIGAPQLMKMAESHDALQQNVDRLAQTFGRPVIGIHNQT